MKITIGPISLDILLFVRLWLPAIVFVGLCMGTLLPFQQVLLLLDQIAPGLIGAAWLSLLIFYIILGVAFTRFVAYLLRSSFGSEERRVRRRMALLSGLPFYSLCLLCLMATLSAGVLYTDSPDVCGSIAVAGAFGFVCFGLVSGSYLLLLRFFLGRLTATAHQ